MADHENAAGLQEYVLLADSARHHGELYNRGDSIYLDEATGTRLAGHNPPSVKRKTDDDPDRGEDLNPGLHDVADEAATIGTSQTVDEQGNPKPSSFGHPDQVEAAEAEVEKAEQRGKGRRTARGEDEPTQDSGKTEQPAETPKAPKAAGRRPADEN